MKREGNCIARIAERDNLQLAYWKASRGRRAAADVVAFGRDLDERLATMAREIEDGTIDVGRFTHFEIRDPKPRRIFAPAFRERVLHHAIMNVCEPRLERYLVADTFACRVGKGVHAAIERAQQFARRHRFVLKLDISGYFDHIDHERLLAMLGRLWKDRRLLTLLERIVRSYEASPGKGLPIGALTSQHFANHYLGRCDWFVKQQLGAQGYVRYMDDMLVCGDDRNVLRHWLQRLRAWLGDELGLVLKPPLLVPAARGVPFLGVRVFPTHCVLGGRRKRRFVALLRSIDAECADGVASEAECQRRATSVLAHAERVRSFGLRRRVMACLAATSALA